ncbi:MAG TPA: DinB family protein [Acidimicrobiales bacterium]
MNTAELLVELYGRIPPLVRGAVDGLDADALTSAPADGSNPIGWTVWHLTRVQDHHMAEILGEDQVWVAPGWAARFGLEPDPSNTGYGHSASEVAAVRPESADALVAYHDAVATRTRRYLESITDDALDRVVDRRWDPPVTLGVRLVSIADDDLQHAGQAAYVRGTLSR